MKKDISHLIEKLQNLDSRIWKVEWEVANLKTKVRDAGFEVSWIKGYTDLTHIGNPSYNLGDFDFRTIFTVLDFDEVHEDMDYKDSFFATDMGGLAVNENPVARTWELVGKVVNILNAHIDSPSTLVVDIVERYASIIERLRLLRSGLGTEDSLYKALDRSYQLILKNEEVKPLLPAKHSQGPRLKWLGSPAMFGHILYELAEKGYIEFPQTRGDRSYARYAKECLNLFDIDTTQGNLEKEINPNKCTLSPTSKIKLDIPNINELR
jgi:hypothetical protein